MRNTFDFRRNRLVLGVASALSLGFASSLFADIDNLDLNLKSQKVSEALVALGKQAGVQIMVEHNVSNEIELAKVQGVYSLSEALKAMLKGSGLIYEFVSDDLVIVKDGAQVDEANEEQKEVEEVVVTGSRIRGVNPIAPVIVIDRDEIERRGAFTAEEIVRTLPQNFASTNSTSTLSNSGTREHSGGFSDYDAAGLSAANLRGMGEGATLILINGRRTAGTPLNQGQFVNLSTIPAHDIERVEVVTQGMSALYGADAAAGVINIILKKNRTEGGSTTVRYETSANGRDRISLTQTGTVGWSSGNATVSLGYTQTDPIDAQKAGSITNDLRSRGGTDHRSSSLFGASVSPFIGFGGLTAPTDYNGVIDTDGDGVNSPEEMAAARALFQPYDRDAPFRENMSTEFSADTKNYYVRLRGEQQLTDNLELYGTANYNTSKHIYGGSPAPGVTVFSSTTAPGLSVPADNPYNPFGTNQTLRYTFYQEVADGLIPDAYRQTEQERTDGSVGVVWDMPFRDWRLDSSITHSVAKSEGLDVGLLTRNSRLDSAGGVDGRSPLERLIQGDHPITGEALTDPADMINLFGNGTVQTPLLALAAGKTRTQNPTYTTSEFSATIDGALFELPAGEVRSVMGVEYRKDLVDYAGNEDRASSAPGVTGGFFRNLIELDRDVIEVFNQTEIPLISEANRLPGIESLAINLAVRWSEYNFNEPKVGEQVADPGNIDIDSLLKAAKYSHVSPGIGISWRPIEDLNIRANWTENFRTPMFTDIIGGGISSGYMPLEFEDGTEIGATPVTIGNPDLKPETSDNLSIGFDWTPASIDGLRVSVTWQSINTNDAITGQPIAGLSADELLERGYLVEEPSDRLGWRLITFPINNDDRVRTFTDFDINYNFDTDFGSFSAGLDGTYFSKNTVYVTDPMTNEKSVYKYDGTNYGPNRIQLRGDLVWYYQDYTASIAANYGSSYTWNNGMASRSSFTELVEDHVEHYITYDLTGSYKTDSGWNIVGGITDVTNNSFPFVDQGAGFNSSKVNIKGRTLFFQIKKDYSL